MPGIFIGIGGIGGSIVAQIRQELKTRVAFAGDTPAANQKAGDFRFLLVDTWRDGYSHGFSQSEVFDIPGGAEVHAVNQRIRGLISSDPPFQEWWPMDSNHAPQMVGNFDHGAGQLRLKGKFAYRISLGSNRTIVSAVEQAYSAIQGVLRDRSGGIVKVYLVSSLGGGTGSGITLALAQHLRQELPEACQLVGVFPLASVTELGPPPMQRQSIWANTDAALREIDYAQRVEWTSRNALNPFLAWGNHDIQGAEAPFKYSYLFGRTNSSGQALDKLSQYIDLIAETLVTESFSDMTAREGLDVHIQGTHSNFIQHLEGNPRIGDRSTAYASAAVAALVYPAERIERHLGRRYGISVLDRMIQANPAHVVSNTDDFIKQEALVWEGTPPFSARFDENLETANGQLSPLPQFRKLGKVEDEKFVEANRSQVSAYVNQVRSDFQIFVSEQFAPHLRQRRIVLVREYSDPERGIRRFARKLLIENGAPALGLTHATVVEIRKTLERQWAEVNLALEGNPNASVPSDGSKKDLLALQERWDEAVNQLGRGFGRVTQKKGQEAKSRFFKSMWRVLRDDTLKHERLLAGRQAYRELITETEKIERALKSLIEQGGLLRQEMVLSTKTDVGEHGASGVLDLSVLDDPKLVAYHFDSLLEQTKEYGVDACAASATAHQVHGDDDSDDSSGIEHRMPEYAGIVLDAFTQKVSDQPRYQDQDFRDQLSRWIVDDGVARLGPQVRQLSIWDALVGEFVARINLGLEDEAVMNAQAKMEQDRAAIIQRGAPPLEWQDEAIKHFIGNKLEQCQNRARPFWQLNSLMPSKYPEAPPSYQFFVLAADDQAYQEASTTLHIGGVLESTATRLNAGQPSSLPGRDRIVIYAREGGVPLFYLTESELADLRSANASVQSQGKFLYTDSRFVRAADDVIRPAETDEELRQFAIAMGIYLGFVRVMADGVLRIVDANWTHDLSEFASVQNFDRVLRDTPDVRKTFFELIDREVRYVKAAARKQDVQQAGIRIRELRLVAAEEDRTTDARYWRSVESAIQSRLDYGRYFLNGQI